MTGETGVEGRLAALLGETADAHHQAFIATDGADSAWPTWYAPHLLDHGLAELLGWSPGLGGLARFLAEADRRHQAEGEGRPWEPFYAELLLAWSRG